jgi:uncharacterized protein (TIGR03083 family)
MTRIARSLSPSDLDRRVPACPDWTVKDLVGHVTSIATGIAEGTVPEELRNLAQLWDPEVARSRELFIEDQIAFRRGHSIDEILADWEKAGAIVEEMLRGERAFPPNAPTLIEWILVTDVGVHHQDLRGAVAEPGDRDSLATGLALRSYVEGMRFRASFEGVPPLRIRAGTREWTIGEGEPVATVTADPFELARAAAGRRSPDQVRAYDWEGDPEPFLTLFYPYGRREEALVE